MCAKRSSHPAMRVVGRGMLRSSGRGARRDSAACSADPPGFGLLLFPLFKLLSLKGLRAPAATRR